MENLTVRELIMRYVFADTQKEKDFYGEVLKKINLYTGKEET